MPQKVCVSSCTGDPEKSTPRWREEKRSDVYRYKCVRRECEQRDKMCVGVYVRCWWECIPVLKPDSLQITLVHHQYPSFCSSSVSTSDQSNYLHLHSFMCTSLWTFEISVQQIQKLDPDVFRKFTINPPKLRLMIQWSSKCHVEVPPSERAPQCTWRKYFCRKRQWDYAESSG